MERADGHGIMRTCSMELLVVDLGILGKGEECSLVNFIVKIH